MINILRLHKLNTTELISFKTQCNDSTFVDKVFKSVKSWCVFLPQNSTEHYRISTEHLKFYLILLNMYKKCLFV